VRSWHLIYFNIKLTGQPEVHITNMEYFIVFNPKVRNRESATQAMPVVSSHQELKTGADLLETTLKGICLMSLMLAHSAVNAGDYIQSPYFKGGKIDSNFNRYDNGDFSVNNFLWSPVFKGGAGTIISETGGQDVNYYGGFARPLLTKPKLGDLFLGVQQVLQGDRISTEVQGEYRLPNGLGLGGGFVDRSQSVQDAEFVKVSYQNQWRDIKYIVSSQWQSFAGKDYGGGYVAVYCL